MTTRVTINKDSDEHNIVVQTRSPTDSADTPITEETIYDDGGTEFLLHSGMTLHIREVEKEIDERELVDDDTDEHDLNED